MSIKSIIEKATNKIAFATDLKGRIYIDVADLQIIIPEISQKIIEEIEKVELRKKVMHDHEYIVDKTAKEIKQELIKNLTS